MAAIDQREFKLIKQFRLRLTDLQLNDDWSSDYSLIRWIRARDHDLNAAEKMLRTSIKWRRDNNIEQLLSLDVTAEYRKKYPYHIGTTRDDGVFVLMVTGRYDFKAVAATNESRDFFLKYFYREFDEITSKMKGMKNSSGIPLTQITMILDLHGFSFTSFLSPGIIQTLINLATYFDANQPERLGFGYLLNASKIITVFLSLLKPVLAQKTLAKFTPVDSDPIKCKQKLLEIISEEELPMLYGGKQANSLLNQFIT